MSSLQSRPLCTRRRSKKPFSCRPYDRPSATSTGGLRARERAAGDGAAMASTAAGPMPQSLGGLTGGDIGGTGKGLRAPAGLCELHHPSWVTHRPRCRHPGFRPQGSLGWEEQPAGAPPWEVRVGQPGL